MALSKEDLQAIADIVQTNIHESETTMLDEMERYDIENKKIYANIEI